MPTRKIPKFQFLLPYGSSVSAGALFVVLVLSGVLYAAIFTCPRCGYEYKAGQAACAHCKNPLPGATAPAPATPPEHPETDNTAEAEPAPRGEPPLRASLIEKEMALAGRMQDQKEYWTAFLLARNARALNGVSPLPTRDRDKQLKAVMAASLAAVEEQSQPCPVCRGAGIRTVIAVDMRGEVKKVLQPGNPCSLCKGFKVVPGLLTEKEHRAGYAKAIRKYRDIQETKNYQRFGPLWYPGHLSPGALPDVQIAAMRSAYGGLCDSCHGIGFSACETCSGIGRISCTNEACVDGNQLCPVCEGKRSVEEGPTRVKKLCRTCAGKGIHTCKTCEGAAHLRCPKCSGSRQFECRSCKGLGETKECSRCDGTGISACRKCNGSGTYRSETCPVCKGEGKALCTSCEGFGHSRKR